MAKLKILHVINDLNVGGTEHLFARHIHELKKNYPQFNNAICILGSRHKTCSEYLKLINTEPIYLEFSGKYRRPRESWRCLRMLHSVIKNENPDLVHTYLWNSDFFSGIARIGIRFQQVSHVVDRRGDRNSPKSSSRFRTRLTGWIHRMGKTKFVAVSEACRQHALTQYRLSSQDVVTIRNGIFARQFDCPERSIISNRPIVIGAISNFFEEKGHHYVIDAVRLLSQVCQDFKLLIAGDGPTRSQCESLTRKLGLSKYIQFMGRVPSAAKFYHTIDLFVVPSIYAEGLPTTILEAMASRLAVVATDVGGVAEAINNGKEGLVISPGNPVLLAEAMGRLIREPKVMRQMGEAGYRRVNEFFTSECMTEAIVDQVYHPLVRPKVSCAVSI